MTLKGQLAYIILNYNVVQNEQFLFCLLFYHENSSKNNNFWGKMHDGISLVLLYYIL